MTASFRSSRAANEQEHRTADMRLIVMDIDSTLINEEVIDLMFSNECSTGPVENQGEISGGFGLASLSARIANSGGFLDASQRGRRWVLVAQLVGRMKE